MNSAELKNRTQEFAYRCINLSLALPGTLLGRHVGGQIIRSDTSVAANYRAACRAQTKASFISKLSIVLEEVDETFFWLELIIDQKLLAKKRVELLLRETNELTAIFAVARKSSRKSTIVNRKS